MSASADARENRFEPQLPGFNHVPFNDLPALRAVGCPLTMADAVAENKKCALYVTQNLGGNGAVREICDLLIASQNGPLNGEIVDERA